MEAPSRITPASHSSNAIGLAIISAAAGAALVQSLHAQQKPKVYAVAEIEVTDSEKFKPHLAVIRRLLWRERHRSP
jgi:hypothetical protein